MLGEADTAMSGRASAESASSSFADAPGMDAAVASAVAAEAEAGGDSGCTSDNSKEEAALDNGVGVGVGAGAREAHGDGRDLRRMMTSEKVEICTRKGLWDEIEWDAYIVDFDGPDDPRHPHNWPWSRTIYTTLLLGYTSLCATIGSAITSSATTAIAEEFGVSVEVSTLGVSLYVCGFAAGPLLWGPLSENMGRKPPVILSMLGFSIFCIATATAKDIQTVLLGRFFAGTFASSPLVVVGAAFADMYPQKYRGRAITSFAAAVFCGPMVAPIMSGFIVKSIGWRWTAYIAAFMGFLSLILDVLFFEECYAPAILQRRAAHMRTRTQCWAWHTLREEKSLDWVPFLKDLLLRPLKLLFMEPIIFLLSIYISFIYGMLYLFLTAYAIEFGELRRWSLGVDSLPYIGLLLGELLGALLVVCFEPWYLRQCAKVPGPIKVMPEARLPPMMIGGVLFSGGLFWFGWSSGRSVPWIVPTLSGLATGCGMISIFLQAFNYIIDSYLMVAASALAANAVMRSCVAAGFPMFATQMFHNLTVPWAASLLGFLAAALTPVPVLFWFYGARLRAMSRHAPKL